MRTRIGDAAEDVAPAGSAATDPQHARHLEGGQAHGLADDAGTDGQGRRHGIASAMTAGAALTPGSSSASPPRASPIRSETRSRAVVAPDPDRVLDHPPRARPWVMITAPRTPSSGDPPTTS